MITRRSFVLGAALAGAAVTGPAVVSGTPARAATAGLPLTLVNASTSATVYAYVTGADSTGWPGFVGPDGVFNRLPNPSATVTPVADHSIALGANGSATVRLNDWVIGGRVWFSAGRKLQFFANPGSPPGLVQPALTPGDPNWATDWTFCEFTYNSANLYANISYVDMVAKPVAMKTTGSAGAQSVSPLPAGALATLAAGLRAQHQSDGAPWDQLVCTDSTGAVLRVLSPTHSPTDFGGYWNSYLAQVWSRYQGQDLTVDTQSGYGALTGRVSGGVLTFAGLDTHGVPFTQPSAADIFGCASGPLYNSGGDARGAVAARLAAALNRSTLLASGGGAQPGGVPVAQYYQNPTTNHYARLVHQVASVGYAFPYDDVGPSGAAPVDGHLQDAAPTSWTVTFGGGSGGTGGGGTSARSTIQAASFTAQSGTATETCTDTGGGLDVGWISAGDWLRYAAVDFGAGSPGQFQARLASGAPAGVSGAVEVRLDSVTGPKIAEVDLANTGGWQAWRTIPANVTASATGVHDLYLVFAGSSTDFVNVHWFTFQ
ncbi:Sugar hydrolase [Kitasatospora sp. MMS16-BH015]|uniref:beta-1,3-glucanase family protein n=1 Tax=Kitasatospora sp. MMS16-BH015 TaxID=2018025 RepID=UPI000CA13330|nr:beta-1,3-glucanase family protein [Kitasatospora sp. MMS16-BH015]AUG80548.1 Sugar hydrolase [Kitasatospora sp. MMS16-BH015]